MSEEERAEIKRNEVNSDIGVDTRHQTLQGLAFPLTTKAIDALAKFQKKQLNYVQLKIGKCTLPLQAAAGPPHIQIISGTFFNIYLKKKLFLDIEKEVIDLVSTTDTDADSLRKRIPETSARYHVFNFSHTHEGDYMESFSNNLNKKEQEIDQSESGSS